MNITSPTLQPPMPDCVVIYASGACAEDTGAGGYAAVLHRFQEGQDISKHTLAHRSEAPTTIARMTMTAAIEALRLVPLGTTVIVRTNHSILGQSWKEMLPAHIAKTHGNSPKKPLENQDLWQEYFAASAGKIVRLDWMRSHESDPRQLEADRLATQAQESPAPRAAAA